MHVIYDGKLWVGWWIKFGKNGDWLEVEFASLAFI